MAGGGWTSTPLLGTAARPGLSGTWPLGSGGLFFAWGCFQVTLQSPQMVPGVGTPSRCVGRGGVLDNLMFSTLTPIFVFKVGVGAAAKSGYWVGPLSPPSSLPASRTQWQAGLQRPLMGAEPWVVQQDLPTSHPGGNTAR